MLKRISVFALIALVIASCSSEEEVVESREIHEYVSASMNGNKEIIAFGNVSVKGILDKTDYQNEQMLQAVIGEELKKLSSVLDMDSPVHFYVEGPVSKDGNPKRTVLFMKVKDADVMATKLEEEYSYLVDEVDDIRYAEDNEFAIGFRGDLAIAIVQPGDYDASKLMKAAFAKSRGDLSGGKTDKMLKTKGDVVVSMNMESLYGTSNTSLNKLSAAKKKKIQQMAKGSFMQMKMNFNKGSMVLESKNYFSKELQDLMFFGSKNSTDLKSKLAIGKEDSRVIAGFSANIDIKKMEKFYASYAPEMLEEMNKEMENMGGVMKFFGAGNLMSSLASGEFGFLAITNDDATEFAVASRGYVGTPEAGQKAFMMMKGEMELPEAMEFNYVDGGLEFLIPMEGRSLNEIKGDKKLSMPQGSESFGKKGVSGFINFGEMSSEKMSMSQKAMFESLDYATFEGDNDGMRFELKMKNSNDNILKQFTQIAMGMMPMLMGGGMPF